jgi:hypothetical protein
MEPLRWSRDAIRRVQRNGLEGIQETAYIARKKLYRGISPYFLDSSYVYENDWDVLVILDACRRDLLASVADDWTFLAEPGEFVSAGSMTREWMEANFVSTFEAEMASTTYICGNPFSDRVLDPNDFSDLNEVWRYGWDDELGTLPARAVTDAAIHASRESNPGRMIVHYMQPHYPFVTDEHLGPGISLDGFASDSRDDVWDKLRKGNISKEDVWNAYRENLEYALEEVEVLQRNVDADTFVITSDHGNAFGEWGIYGHPQMMPLNVLRVVPWVETKAEDHGERVPDIGNRESENDVSEYLAALGYVEE